MTSLPISMALLESHRSIFRRFQHVIIQHLKNDTAEIAMQLVGLGCRIRHLIAIDYSVDAAVLSTLEGSGIAISVKNFQAISEFISKLITECEEDDVVIWDVGGYGVDVTSDIRLSQKVRFAVEDTNNGLWRYQSAILRCPVIEVASIKNKQVENAFVGRRIVEAMESFFRQNGLAILGKQVAVVGFGGIGQSVCAALSTKDINPAVVEIDDRKLALAYAFGHEIAVSIANLPHVEVVIGCSGTASVKMEDLKCLRGRAFLISGSSKKIEFSDVFAQGRIAPIAEIGNALVELTTNSVIVNDGEPINLRYGSLNNELSDFMYANIIAAVVEGSSKRGNIVSPLSDEWQRRVSHLWVQRYLQQCA